MKKTILLFPILLFSGITNAQVGIATTNPNPSTILDVVSTDAGIMIPRVALTGTTDAVTISNGNVESLLVYNTQTISDVTPGFYYWYDNKWQRLINSATNDWSLTGNAGTNESLNFIGTTDNRGLVFKTNNVKTGFISNDGKALHFGKMAGGYSGSFGASNGSIDNTVFLGEDAGVDASDAGFSNFIGTKAGYKATGATVSNFIGYRAGEEATNAANSNFIGEQAGRLASEAWESNFIGLQAGGSATNANRSNFIGISSGLYATDASHSVFVGGESGLGASLATGSCFIGYQAGNGVSSGGEHSNFIGRRAGMLSSATESNFIGWEAGYQSANTQGGIFIGTQSGYNSNGNHSAVFIGDHSGYQSSVLNGAVAIGNLAGFESVNCTGSILIGNSVGGSLNGATNSIFIGQQAGAGDTVDNSSSPEKYSILIGQATSTGGFSNSIAIGRQAENTASNQMMIGSNVSPIDNLVVKGKGGVTLPLGTTAERPVSPDFGTIRYNSTIGRAEVYVNDVNGDGTQGDAGWRAI